MTNTEKPQNQKPQKVILALILVGIISYIGYHYLNKPDYNKLAIEKAKKVVLKDLKDPDSAQFRNIKVVIAGQTSLVASIVCGEVNAKNSFGAYTGFKKFDYSANILSLEGAKPDPYFDSVHEVTCKSR